MVLIVEDFLGGQIYDDGTHTENPGCNVHGCGERFCTEDHLEQGELYYEVLESEFSSNNYQEPAVVGNMRMEMHLSPAKLSAWDLIEEVHQNKSIEQQCVMLNHPSSNLKIWAIEARCIEIIVSSSEPERGTVEYDEKDQ